MVEDTTAMERTRLWRAQFKEGDLERYEIGAKYMEGGKLDKFFDALGTFSYMQGAFEMDRIADIERINREFAGDEKKRQSELLKVPAPTMIPIEALARAVTDPSRRETLKYAITHRVEPSTVHQDTFAKGMGRNIAMDPTSWIPGGAIKGFVGGTGSKIMSHLPSPARRPIEYGIEQLSKGGEIIGAGKTKIKNTVLTAMGAGYGWVGAKLGKAKDVVGEIMEPGYKLKQLGPQMKEFYDDYMDMVMTRRGAVTQAVHEVKTMGRPFKRAGAAAMDYVERGVSTGVEGLDQYLDDVVKPFLTDIRAKELAAGYDIGKVVDYVPHVLADKGQELIGKHGSYENTVKYLKDQARMKYGMAREMTGGVTEINEMLGGEFFMEDLWEAVAVRAQRSASDRATTSWLEQVEKRFGVDEAAPVVQEVLTKAAGDAKKQFERNRVLVEPFERALTEIAAGRTPAQFLSNVVDMAASGPLKGKLPRTRQLVARLKEFSERKTDADVALRDIYRDIKTYTSNEALELLKGGTQYGSRISREALEDSDRIVSDIYSKIPSAEERIARAMANLRGESMSIQSEIIDPARRRMAGLVGKTSETKRVKTVEAAIDDITDYAATKREDITKKLPVEMAKFLDELTEVPVEDTLTNTVIRKYGWWRDKWKKSVTLGIGPAIHGAFYTRNVGTGTFQNVQQIGLARTTRGIFDAARLSLGIGSFETKEFGPVSAEVMQKLMRESGQLGGTGMADVKVAQTMYPTRTQKVMGVGGALMQWTEAMVREPLFLEEMREGTARQARMSVKETHFDYSPEAMTKYQRFVKDYAVPFLTFEMFNVQRQFKQLFQDPRFFDVHGKVQRESLRVTGMEEEFERRPEWQEDMYMVPNPMRPGSFMMAPTPITSITFGGSGVYHMISPLKSALELAAIDAGWGTKEYKEEKKDAIIKNVFLGRYTSTLKRWTDMDKPASDKIMHEMGLPVYDAMPEKVSFEEFEQYRYRMIDPTKEQEYEAFMAAGGAVAFPTGFQILRLGPKAGGMGVEVDKTIEAPWWKFWEKDTILKAVKHEYELAGLAPDIMEMGRGYPWDATSWAEAEKYKGPARTDKVTEMIIAWDDWKSAQHTIEPVTTAQRMAAWERDKRTEDATDRVYRDEAGKVLSIVSFSPSEIEEITEYIAKGVQLSDAHFEWAHIQKGMTPSDWLTEEYRKADVKYMAAMSAREELKGFHVDQPVDATTIGMTQAMEYSAYRQNRVDYEQDLIEKAMGRGEVS